jgi:thiol:disulfide interchange protein DsbD
MNKLVFSFFLLGLSFGMGPCLASCGPLLISYAAGTNSNSAKSLWIYILFSLSRIFVYLALGVSIFMFGQMFVGYALESYSRYFYIFGGIFLILVGFLIILGRDLNYKFCKKMQSFFLQNDTKTVITLGLIIGIVPCAPFVSVLSYIGLVSKTWLDSLTYSLSFGLGTLVSPLLLLLFFAGLIPKIIIQRARFNRIFNSICGLIIIFLGVKLIIRTM